MSWFYRVVQTGEQEWQCRFGVTVFDTHADRCAAVEHSMRLAAEHRPSVLFEHRAGHLPQRIGQFD